MLLQKAQNGDVEPNTARLQALIDQVAGLNEIGHLAEMWRIKGILDQIAGKADTAAIAFEKSLSVAQKQIAKSWELRAATSLARLWRSQGKTSEARDLLAPVYDWFTEGFDTPDLIDAKALLDELA
jgi:predicted ATPase